MARRMNLDSHEMGRITLLAIKADAEGQWEPDWEPLRGSVFGDQFSLITKTILDHALHGLSRPLTEALGIPPAGALRKIPKPSRECFLRHKCTFYERDQCFVGAPKRPWCFEPDEIQSEDVRKAATKAIEEWEQGVYLVVVTDA